MGLLAQRPDIKLPLEPLDFHVLLALAVTPLEVDRILRFVGEQSENSLKVSNESIYDQLRHLIKKGWILQSAGVVNDGHPERKTYELSSNGRRVLKAEIKRMEMLVKHAYIVGLMDG